MLINNDQNRDDEFENTKLLSPSDLLKLLHNDKNNSTPRKYRNVNNNTTTTVISRKEDIQKENEDYDGAIQGNIQYSTPGYNKLNGVLNQYEYDIGVNGNDNIQYTNDKIVNDISYVSKNINSLLKNDTKKITSNSKVMNNRIQKLSQTNKDSILKAERKLKYGMSLP